MLERNLRDQPQKCESISRTQYRTSLFQGPTTAFAGKLQFRDQRRRYCWLTKKWNCMNRPDTVGMLRFPPPRTLKILVHNQQNKLCFAWKFVFWCSCLTAGGSMIQGWGLYTWTVFGVQRSVFNVLCSSAWKLSWLDWFWKSCLVRPLRKHMWCSIVSGVWFCGPVHVCMSVLCLSVWLLSLCICM